MRIRHLFVLGALMCALLTSQPGVRAASSLPVTYPAGWNMVGGPAGTSFAALGTLYGYGPAGYTTVSSGVAQNCTGYWAALAASHVVNLAPVAGGAAPAFGTALGCSLQQGWTLVGNPFPGVAMLPPGETGWWWNPATSAYQLALSIPAGGAIWLYSTAPRTVDLYYAPADTVVVTRTGPGRPQVHVGQHIALAMAGSGNTVITSNLTLESAISTGDSAHPVQLWLWHADAVGVATIMVQLPCQRAKPPCLIPDVILEIDVVA